MHQINAAYKLSSDTQQAAICYQKCNDLLFQIKDHGYICELDGLLVLMKALIYI